MSNWNNHVAISHLTHIIRGNVYIVIHMEITRVTSCGLSWAGCKCSALNMQQKDFDKYIAVWS